MLTREEFVREAERIRPRLLAGASRFLHDAGEAEDVVQDVLLRLWTLRDELTLPMEPLACVLVRNFSIDLLRRRRRRAALADAGGSEAVEEAVAHGQIERLMTAVNSLPSMQQLILRLRHVEGMDYSEIAKLTGSREEAVRKALSRARKAVKDKYMNNREDL